MNEPAIPRRLDLRRFPPELAALLALGFSLRLAVYFVLPNIHWPDEIYQTLEPAHRLVFGTGITSWEWAVGIRSWLLPGLYAGLMEIGRLFGSDPATINLPVALFMAAAACAPIACGYGWGRKFFGRSGGAIVGGLNAVWVDLVYMSTHALTEVVAADCLIVALYLGAGTGDSEAAGDGTPWRRRLFLTGFMLGLTFALRFHLGPALLVAAIGLCGIESWPRWRALLAGASLPVLALGLLDWATLGMPFQSVTLNFWLNIGANISSGWGTDPFATLLVLPFYLWGGGAALILFTALIGARQAPLLLLVCLTIFLTHSLIPHKEYRFIFPALPLLTTLAGLGTAELVRLVRERRPEARKLGYGLTAVALFVWALTSVAIAQSTVFHSPWTRARAHLLAFRYIAQHLPEACGVGLYGVAWPVTPGQTWLPAGLQLYQTNLARLPHEAPGFNVILARRQAPVPDPNYARIACFDGDEGADGIWRIHLCLWQRPGGCDPAAATLPEINWPPYFRNGRPTLEDEPPGWKDDDAG